MLIFNSPHIRHEAGQECGSNLPGLLQTEQPHKGQHTNSHSKVGVLTTLVS